jgi:hypothetical protein
MADVLKNLPRLSWRGIEIPILSRRAGFAQGEQKHRYVYRDQEFVESTGTENWTFSYTIPFREGVSKLPYKSLFKETFTKFINACRDRTSGPLIDPVLGPFIAKCTSLSDETDVNRRDGDDINVEFVQAPEEDSEQELKTNAQLVSVISEAGDLDSEVVGIDWKQTPAPEPTIDPLLYVDSMIRMAQFRMGQLAARVDSMSSKIERTADAIESLGDPLNSALVQSARRAQAASSQLATTVMSPGRKISTYLTPINMSISVCASKLGMSTGALLMLNPSIAISPEITKGTKVFFYGD